MSQILRALQQLHAGANIPVKAIEQYIRTGDKKTLAQVKPAKQSGWSWEGTVLAAALGKKAGDWTDEDRRLVHVLHALGLLESLSEWLNDALSQEKAGADAFAPLRSELEANHATTAEIAAALGRVRTFERDAKPTSAGRFVLSLSDRDIESTLEVKHYHSNYLNLDLVGFLVDFAIDRLPALFPVILKDRGHSSNDSSAAALILQKAGKRFEQDVHAFFLSMKDTWHRFHLAQTFYDVDQSKYGAEALAAARASLAGSASSNNHGPVAEWMLEKFGPAVLDDIVAYLDDKKQNRAWHWKTGILKAAVATLGKDALPAVHATLRGASYGDLRLDAVNYLIALNDGSQDGLIQTELENFLKAEPDPRPNYRTTDSYQLAVRAIGLVGRWNAKRFADSLWKLFAHKSKALRDAAARVLGLAGEESVVTAAKLLCDKKAATRLAAVLVLTTANSAEALKALEDRLDDETDDSVRDAILLGLEAAWAAQGRKVTKKDVEARIARVADKLAMPADWIDEAKLPRLAFKDDKPLSKDAVRYLLYRQARAKEIRPDIEANALFAMIDRSKSGDFALHVLKAFLSSNAEAQDRWALTVAGLLGDDRVVPLLSQQIRDWADGSRGKMAEYAVEALALLGTDAALLMVDALAIRYRSKNKNVGRAAVESFNASAASLGLTPEELGDRVVPWLGFEPDQPRIIDCGSKKVEARIGLDFKLKYIDLEKKKPIASLPKTAPKEVLTQFKELGTTLREVAKAQVLRLENMMVRQYRWPMERWRQLFPVHPLLAPMAIRLIWGVYDQDGKLQAAFRMLEDRSFTQSSDEPFEFIAAGTIGIVHPLELSADERQAWQTHLADYEIEPPFPQLERPVVRLPQDRAHHKALKEYAGISINGMTFKGRAERLGWTRGSVCDGGGITSYVKGFPAAGVDVFLGLDGMYIGIDMYSEIKLQDAFFARSGSVKTGSYTYDEPNDEKDERLLRFGDVPPIVYSEVIGDLQKISGKKEDANE